MEITVSNRNLPELHTKLLERGFAGGSIEKVKCLTKTPSKKISKYLLDETSSQDSLSIIQREKTFAYEIAMECMLFYGISHIPLAIYQTHAMDATISWLSLARCNCFLYGQTFFISQHKTLTRLAAQQPIGG